MTESNTEKAVPLQLLMEFAEDPHALLTITRLMQYMRDLRKAGFTGPVRLDCKDGLARKFSMTVERDLYK